MTDMKVTLIDHMGSDLSVVNAARVSFDKESEYVLESDEEIRDGKLFFVNHRHVLSEADTRLISYLVKHNHWSPFAHTCVSLRIKAPIFVARQLGKSVVGLSWNEVSRRYVDSEPEFYQPDIWRKRAENVKQGSSEEAVDLGKLEDPTLGMAYQVRTYEALLAKGVCPEQARMVLPQSMMTEWIWTGSLAAFARVCGLRLDRHTQAETREVAVLIAKTIEPLFPVSWKELMNGTEI